MIAQTIEEAMLGMPETFIPDRAKGVDMVIQFIFAGEQAGQWYVTVKDQKATVDQGKATNPTATISANGQDYLKIMTGQLDGAKAFMQGKLKVTGNMNALMKVQAIFKMTQQPTQQ